MYFPCLRRLPKRESVSHQLPRLEKLKNFLKGSTLCELYREELFSWMAVRLYHIDALLGI